MQLLCIRGGKHLGGSLESLKSGGIYTCISAEKYTFLDKSNCTVCGQSVCTQYALAEVTAFWCSSRFIPLDKNPDEEVETYDDILERSPELV